MDLEVLSDLLDLLSDLASGRVGQLVGMVAAVVAVVALIWCFFGYKIIKLIFAVMGFFLGFLLGGFVFAAVLDLEGGAGVILAILTGILGAFLLFRLYKLGVFLTTAGIVILISILLADSRHPQVSIILGVILGILVGILAVKLVRLLMIFNTALSGGIVAGEALLLVFQVNNAPAGLLLGLVLAVLGFLYQWKSTGGGSVKDYVKSSRSQAAVQDPAGTVSVQAAEPAANQAAAPGAGQNAASGAVQAVAAPGDVQTAPPSDVQAAVSSPVQAAAPSAGGAAAGPALSQKIRQYAGKAAEGLGKAAGGKWGKMLGLGFFARYPMLAAAAIVITAVLALLPASFFGQMLFLAVMCFALAAGVYLSPLCGACAILAFQLVSVVKLISSMPYYRYVKVPYVFALVCFLLVLGISLAYGRTKGRKEHVIALGAGYLAAALILWLSVGAYPKGVANGNFLSLLIALACAGAFVEFGMPLLLPHLPAFLRGVLEREQQEREQAAPEPAN